MEMPLPASTVLVIVRFSNYRRGSISPEPPRRFLAREIARSIVVCAGRSRRFDAGHSAVDLRTRPTQTVRINRWKAFPVRDFGLARPPDHGTIEFFPPRTSVKRRGQLYRTVFAGPLWES